MKIIFSSFFVCFSFVLMGVISSLCACACLDEILDPDFELCENADELWRN